MRTGNHFLDQLEPKDYEALEPHLRRLELVQDRVLTRGGERMVQAFLPVDAIISVVLEMRDGDRVETRTVGREGGVGLLQALGAPIAYETVQTQISGSALAIDLRELTVLAAGRPTLTHAIVRHAQATLMQTAQSVACNGLHDVRQRLCRWLLLTQDRLQRDELPLKQHHLAVMLAVQRTTVTAIASQLQREGVIRYSRGKVTVLDREGLLERACECYADLEIHVRRVLDAQAQV